MSNTIGPGDLCVVIKSVIPANIGCIVQADRLMYPNDEVLFVDGVRLVRARWRKSPGWLVWTKGRLLQVPMTSARTREVVRVEACRASVLSQDRLRKLDFNTDQDEMLTLLGKPVDLHAQMVDELIKELLKEVP